MGKANNKPLYTTPSLEDEVFGFKSDGEDVNIPLSAIQELFDKANSGITNEFQLSKNNLEEGTFTSNSLVIGEVTTLDFNNKSSEGIDYTEYFEMLDSNKDDVFLVLTEVGFEINAVFKINSVNFDGENNTVFTVSLHNTLKRTNFILGKIYTISFDVENDVFTQTQSDRLKNLVYEKTVQSLSVSPTTFEKGLATDLTYTWNVDKKDDTLVSVTLDGSDVLSQATGVNRTYDVNNQIDTKSVVLQTNVTENDLDGGTNQITTSRTSTAIIPQYVGKVTFGNSPSLVYVDLQSHTKFLSTLSARSYTSTFSNEVPFFLSINSNATILDVNGFDVTAGFTKSTVTMNLASGTQSMTLYLYNSALNSTGTLSIN